MSWLRYIAIFCITAINFQSFAQTKDWTFTITNNDQQHTWLLEYTALYLCFNADNCEKISHSFDALKGNTLIKPGATQTLTVPLSSDVQVDPQTTNWHINAIAYWEESGELKQKICFLDYKQDGVQWLPTIDHPDPVKTGCEVTGPMENVKVVLH